MTELPFPLANSSVTSSVERPRTPAIGVWGLRFTALTYLTVFILVPLLVVHIQGLRFGWDVFWSSISTDTAVNAIWLSVWTSALMAVINTVMGTLTAYVLVAYRFPGKALFNTLIDLPFAIPTLVTGVMLVLLFGPQTFIGAFFHNQLRFDILFATPGIVIALLFVGYPFVIRTVQPLLLQLDIHQQEAAHTIGASPWYTFRHVIFPALRPAITTDALLSFARSLGEFGAVIVVSGGIKTGTVYVYAQVEAGNLQAASSVSLVLLFIAFAITVSLDFFHWRRYA